MILSINVINILNIIALILKVIGIVLLSILGFILLIFALVFFVPVRYRVSAQNEREDMTAVKAEGSVTYLLHMVSVKFGYIKGAGSNFSLKLFGFTLKSSDKPSKQKKGRVNDEDEYYEDPEGLSGVSDFLPDDENVHTGGKTYEQINTDNTGDSADSEVDRAEDGSSGSSDNKASDSNPSPADQEAPPEIKKQKKEAKKQAKEAKEEKKRLKKAKKKSKNTDSEGENVSKLDKLKEKIEEVKKIVGSPGNRKLFSKAKKELFYLLKHYLPRKVTGSMAFGFDKPDMTGKVLGAMSLFPFLYHNGFKVKPDFETDKLYFCGDIDAKGKIRLIHLLKTVIVLLLDKDFRRIVFKKKLY
ncbi:MAG: hypothetical protein IKQ56_09810 [Lachnospiraceae bacterium]|nr:hypothetical protein [Lachnospiraceae bacterium]